VGAGAWLGVACWRAAGARHVPAAPSYRHHHRCTHRRASKALMQAGTIVDDVRGLGLAFYKQHTTETDASCVRVRVRATGDGMQKGNVGSGGG
jgi:hypothetical protein